jgi:hypothetical protein
MMMFLPRDPHRRTRMSMRRRRVLALVGVSVGFSSLAVVGSQGLNVSRGMRAGWSERGEEVVR